MDVGVVENFGYSGSGKGARAVRLMTFKSG